MLISSGILTLRYEQNHRPGMFLGRHLELDGRSLSYRVSLEEARQKIVPIRHEAPIPTLDQGHLGSCTGNAGTKMLAYLHKDNLGAVTLGGKSLSATDARQNEEFAVELYHQATVNDGFDGTFPPEDTGSSGLGVMRSARLSGLVRVYYHALTLRGMASMLQKGPNIVGMPWYDAFFSPDGNGFIDSDPNWQRSGLAGGHEIYQGELEAWDESDASKCIFVFDNSWGSDWGQSGRFRMRGSTYNAMREQIDVMQGRL